MTHKGARLHTERVASLRAAIYDAQLLVRCNASACLRILATRRKLLSTRLARMTSHFSRVRNVVGLCRTLNKKQRWGVLFLVFVLSPLCRSNVSFFYKGPVMRKLSCGQTVTGGLQFLTIGPKRALWLYNVQRGGLSVVGYGSLFFLIIFSLALVSKIFTRGGISVLNSSCSAFCNRISPTTGLY